MVVNSIWKHHILTLLQRLTLGTNRTRVHHQLSSLMPVYSDGDKTRTLGLRGKALIFIGFLCYLQLILLRENYHEIEGFVSPVVLTAQSSSRHLRGNPCLYFTHCIGDRVYKSNSQHSPCKLNRSVLMSRKNRGVQLSVGKNAFVFNMFWFGFVFWGVGRFWVICWTQNEHCAPGGQPFIPQREVSRRAWRDKRRNERWRDRALQTRPSVGSQPSCHLQTSQLFHPLRGRFAELHKHQVPFLSDYQMNTTTLKLSNYTCTQDGGCCFCFGPDEGVWVSKLW